MGLPVIEAEYKNWSLGFDGVRYRFVDNETRVAVVGLGCDFGREEDDLDNSWRGVGDVHGGLALTGFISYAPTDWLGLEAEIIRSDSEAESLTVTVGAEAVAPLSENMLDSVALHTTRANEDHMDGYYAVNATQSSRSGLRRF